MSGSLTSPLTLQMLMAGNGAPQDPALTAALPRLQFAQALMQQGTSDAPTSKWGALSRLGQALVGNLAFDKGQEGIQDILKQRQADTVNAVGYMRGGASPASVPSPVAAPNASATSAQPGAIGTYATQLGASEGGTPQAVNSGGYSGQYQYGASRLADPGVGVYAPAPGEDLKANQWKGSFNIPGFANVKTHADFLANPDAQKTVLAIDTANTDKAIAGIPGAANYDLNGLRAVAHLGGVDGMRQFVTTGGKYNPADSNGTSLSDYYQKFSGRGMPSAPSVGYAAPAPTVDQGLDMMRRAQDMMVAHPYNPAIQHAAQAQIQYAQTLMGLAEKRFTVGPNGIQTSGMGEQKSAATPAMNYQPSPGNPGMMESPGHKPVFAPAPRTFTDAHGNTGAVGPGGVVTPIAGNPSGITGSAPETNAMRTIAELGPKVLSGTATPQELANYHVAATTYQHFKTVTDPATKSLVSVPENPLPQGAPPSGPGHAPSAPLTGSARGPDTAQAATEQQMKDDAAAISKDQADTLKDHAILGTSQTIRSMIPQVTQGVGADARLRAAQIFQSLGVAPDTAKAWLGTSAAPGEILQKKLFELSTGAERAAMGARGSGAVVGMFTKNYPNLSSQNMTTDAMTRLLDMDQIYKENDASARQQHYTGQVQEVQNNKPYGGMASYQPPDPRVYQAAALASGGMPYSVWTAGLTPEQQTQALQLAAKVYPDATALDAHGVKHQFRSPTPGGGGG